MSRISDATRRLGTASAATIAGLLLATPAPSFALSTKAASPFCTELPAKSSAITASITSLVNKATAAWAQQDANLAAHEAKVDQDVAADRQQADAKRSADYTKLETKATTTAEKTAVQTYETAINTAVAARRSAYDSARSAFRSGVKDAILARRSTVTSQFSTFQAAVSTALGTAAASCVSTPNDGPSIRTTLQASLKTARTTFEGERSGDAKIGSTVQSLAATRNTAFKAADQTFQTTASAARQALKQAFGSSSTSV